jgi:anti-sigma factor RsiW
MNQHYSESDLLETWYTAPGESMPVMMHLADCPECAERWERLDRKIRSLAACEEGRPASFWARQRHSIMHSIEQRQARPSAAFFRPLALAAVALLALGLLLAGAWGWLWTDPATPQATSSVVTATAEASQPVAELSVPTDPWQSEELNDLHSLVAWESWIEDGDQPL